MARRHRQRVKKHREPDPEAVLAGREDVTLDDLFRLIHEVNPTGEDLDPRQKRRRYERKSGLQSLLVRRFSEWVTVAPTDAAGIVSLAHRSASLDACHAAVDDLEPDARAWVRRQLDLAVSPEPPAEPAVSFTAATEGESSDDPDALVARASRAVRDYEYDVAETCLREALAATGGALVAARPLLELWVELLGMDEQALAVEPRLTAAAREDPRVRSLLALAAARQDDVDHALLLLQGLPAAAAAEVYAALVRAAVSRRDLEAAERFLAETESLDPAHPELDGLRRGVAELVADAVRSDEEALAERHRRDGAAAAENEARALLARWPESAVARRVLHEAAELKRRKADEEARARALARRQAEESEAERRLDAVVRTFDGDADAAHLAYLALPAALRERARERLGRPSLEWLEEAGAPSSGHRAQAAAAAVRALERACGLDGDTPEAVLEALRPHQKALRDVALAGRLQREAEQALAAARRRRARAAFDAALAAEADGRLDELPTLLEEVDAGLLDPGRLASLAGLRQRRQRAESRERRIAEHREAVERDDLVAVRDRARELAEDGDEAWRERWLREVDRAREGIREKWGVEVDRGERPLSEVRDFRPPETYGIVEAWLDDECGEMILPRVRGSWLFLQVIDLRRRRVVERVSLRSPTTSPPLSVCYDGGLVCIVDDAGAFLELRRDGWEVWRWGDLGKLVREDEVLRDVFTMPGDRHVWLAVDEVSEGSYPEQGCRVVDLETLCVRREHSVLVDGRLLHPGGPHVACHDGNGTRIFSGRGAEVTAWRSPHVYLKVAVAPDGRILTLDPGPEPDVLVLTLHRDEETAGPREELRVSGCWPTFSKLLAVSAEDSLVFLRLLSAEKRFELLAVSVSEDGLEELYRVPFPWDAAWVQNRRGDRLYAIHLDATRLRMERLGRKPPRPEFFGHVMGTALETRPPSFQGPHACEAGDPILDVTKILRKTLFTPRFGTEREREEVYRDLESHPWTTVAGLLHRRRFDDCEVLADGLSPFLTRRPEHEATRFLLAVLSAEDRDWDEVLRLLSPVDPTRIGGGYSRHFHHLLGLSRLVAGRWREARASFELGEREKGHCDFSQLLELTEVLEAGEVSERQGAVERPLVWQLCGAIQAADRAFAAGDPAAVAVELDRPVVWGFDEVQSAARLAAAWLEVEARTPAELFSKRQALAHFYGSYSDGVSDTVEMPGSGLGLGINVVRDRRRRSLDLAPFAWGEKRLLELADAAYRWLAEQSAW